MRDFAIIQGALPRPLPFPYIGVYKGQERIYTRKTRGSL